MKEGKIGALMYDGRMKVESEEEMGDYFDCRFILGSLVKVERVWSMADKILQPSRFSTCPYLLEVILFLKFNNKYWDSQSYQFGPGGGL
jgi:hypothetical protein